MGGKAFIILLIFPIFVVPFPINNGTGTTSVVDPIKDVQTSPVVPECTIQPGHFLCSPKPIKKTVNAVPTQFATYSRKYKSILPKKLIEFENFLQRAIDYLIVWVIVTVIFVLIMVFTYPCYVKAINSGNDFGSKNALNL